ncbi:hypothetical protein GCM10009557_35210 [Virgisporangium ochraceum]|uniref:Uncharacterized protein n=1 Tax=Virgisporangium ochraceum TaxID=65505 RepID=A0A8J4EGX3_9ACTN|nr:hypothetical protein Voc01_101670 [Virgisporangium ochraceum]
MRRPVPATTVTSRPPCSGRTDPSSHTVAGCLTRRTPTAGADHWLRVRSYISTVMKTGINVLQALHDALTGNPWLPATPST